MHARQALIANGLRCVAATAVVAGAMIVHVSPSAGADLLRRHHRHSRHGGLAIYRDDRICER